MSSSSKERTRLVITVSAEGVVQAETMGVVGEACLDYIAVLEDLAGSPITSSRYTSDYANDYANVAVDLTAHQENHGVEHA
jgi:hypothetical protein